MNPETLSLYFNNAQNDNVEEDNFMNIELFRLSSYQHFPRDSAISTIKLSSAGLFYTGTGDKVKCYKCNFTKDNWLLTDNPFKEHKNQFPTCPVVSGCDISDNIPVAPVETLRECFSRLPALVYDDGGENYPSVGSSSFPSIPDEDSFGNYIDRGNNSITEMDSPQINGGDRPSTLGGGEGSSSSTTSGGARGQGAVPKTTLAQGDSGARGPGPTASGSSTHNREYVPTERNKTRELIRNMSGPTPSKKETPPQALAKDSAFLRFEKNRLESFKSWPAGHPIPPPALARAGFFYVGNDDRVRCVFCELILKDWDAGDNPLDEHKNKNPKCKFVLGLDVNNVPITSNYPEGGHRVPMNQTVVSSAASGSRPRTEMEQLGINTQRPKYPNYAIESARLQSFNKWPRNKHQTSDDLSNAGFFYAGFADNVKCFFCDGGLKNWETGDDPWVEHARWFPRCTFLKNVKGDQYIQSIQSMFVNQNGTNIGGRIIATGQRPQVEEREINARMDTTLVRTVLDIGVEREVVKRAIRNRLLDKGEDFPSAEQLMNAVMDMSERPEDLLAQRRRTSETNSETSNSVASTSEHMDLERANSVPSSRPPPMTLVTEPGERNKSVDLDHDLKEEVRQLKEQKLCKICLDDEVGVVFLPCGHLCCCVKCGPAVQQCPICRTSIRGTVRTYIP